MAQFAPVVPIQIARWMKKQGILGKYHLLLAHDVLARPDDYREVYGNLVGDMGATIIMDNSVVELGEAMDISQLVCACDILRPNYLVVPDVMGDAKGTWERCMQFTQELPRSFDVPLLGVCPGNTVEEIKVCAHNMVALPEIMAISIPRIVTKALGSRIEAVVEVYAELQYDLGAGPPIHLLGFSDDLLDDVCASRLPGVVGIDSAVPIRAAIWGESLSLDTPKDFGPRGSYWEDSVGEEFQQRLLRYNMDTIQRWIKV